MTGSLVSVCIPVFNHEKYIQRCIQSVIDQEYENIELIVIDDGSSDQSAEKINQVAALCETRFKKFNFVARQNKGLCNTINEALARCSGEYFAILASDDQWLPGKLSIQVSYLSDNRNVAGVFGGINIINDNDEILRTKVLSRLSQYGFEQVFLSDAFLPAPSALIRTQQVKNTGGFNEGYRIEDWYMWLKLTEQGNRSLDCLPDVVANYRRHATNLSKNQEFMLGEQYKIIDLYKNHRLYKKAEASLKIAAYTSMVPRSKLGAVALVPGFLSLWRESRFWLALAKMLVPKSVLLKHYN